MLKKYLKPPQNNSLITQHFGRKYEDIEAEINTEVKKKSTVEFYERSLQESIHSTQTCENNSCSIAINEFEKKIAAAKSELNRIMVGHSMVISICEEKDMQIKCLKSEIELTSTVKNSDFSNGFTAVQEDAPLTQESLALLEKPLTNVQLFSQFVNDFTNEQLESIRKIGNSSAEDSTFVLNVLRFLYYADLHQLFNVSATGRSSKGKTKEKIPEEKIIILKGMFSERLENLRKTSNQVEIDQRMKRLNKLLNAAITNAQKSIKKIDQLEKKNTE